jgi:tetratricopeptide (TPR) repeat protein
MAQPNGSRDIHELFAGLGRPETDIVSLFADHSIREFQQIGTQENLDAAICCTLQVLVEKPEGDLVRAFWQNNLAVLLANQYERTENIQDLVWAISMLEEAMGSIPLSNPGRPVSLTLLGDLLEKRYEKEKKREDLEEGIRVREQAVRAVSAGSSDWIELLNNLGNLFIFRFDETRRIENLNEAICKAQQVVDSSRNHPDFPGFVDLLANRLQKRIGADRRNKGLGRWWEGEGEWH